MGYDTVFVSSAGIGTGGVLMEGDEGPFAVFYEPSRRAAVEVQFNDDPYDRAAGFQPYSATLLTPGLSLVTVVTPDQGQPLHSADSSAAPAGPDKLRLWVGRPYSGKREKTALAVTRG
jgi:hypothetical protein